MNPSLYMLPLLAVSLLMLGVQYETASAACDCSLSNEIYKSHADSNYESFKTCSKERAKRQNWIDPYAKHFTEQIADKCVLVVMPPGIYPLYDDDRDQERYQFEDLRTWNLTSGQIESRYESVESMDNWQYHISCSR